MYQPRTLGDHLAPYAIALAHKAREGRLVIHAGSGLSVAEPTGIKAGPALAEDVGARLEGLIGPIPDCDRSDLESVADAVAGLPGGLDALKQAILSSNEYLSAEPNYGHRVLALLVHERAAKVLTTNWDNCIERGAEPEVVQAVIVDLHLGLAGNPILKLHGCATLVGSMLVTGDEMRNPPPWAVNEAKSRLAGSEVVFIGTGSPSPYVKDGIKDLLTAPPTNITVVSPSIATGWDDSNWVEILPELDHERRISSTADEFLDELARSYVRLALEDVQVAVSESETKLQALQRVVNGMNVLSAHAVLRWFRAAAVPKGEAEVMFSQMTAVAIVAIGLLGMDSVFESPSDVRVDGVGYSVIIDMGKLRPSRLRAEASRRLERFLAGGGLPADAPRFLISSAFEVAQAPSSVADVVGTSRPEDVVNGPLSGHLHLVDARRTIENA